MMNDAQHKTSKFLFSIAIALMLALIATGAFAKPSAQLLAKAEEGDAQAQYELGEMYYFGEKGTEVNGTQAAHWYLKAAEQGHAQAQYSLAVLYNDGELVHADMKKALYWYGQAAQQGHSGAMTNIGSIFTIGQLAGVVEDVHRAAYWYEKAHALNNPYATYFLAALKWSDRLGASDKETAWTLYEQAAAQGLEEAHYALFIFTYELFYADGKKTAEDLFYWAQVNRHTNEDFINLFSEQLDTLPLNAEQRQEITAKANAYYAQADQRWQALLKETVPNK